MSRDVSVEIRVVTYRRPHQPNYDSFWSHVFVRARVCCISVIFKRIYVAVAGCGATLIYETTNDVAARSKCCCPDLLHGIHVWYTYYICVICFTCCTQTITYDRTRTQARTPHARSPARTHARTHGARMMIKCGKPRVRKQKTCQKKYDDNFSLNAGSRATRPQYYIYLFLYTHTHTPIHDTNVPQRTSDTKTHTYSRL